MLSGDGICRLFAGSTFKGRKGVFMRKATIREVRRNKQLQMVLRAGNKGTGKELGGVWIWDNDLSRREAELLLKIAAERGGYEIV
jgi:hypothetical protein